LRFHILCQYFALLIFSVITASSLYIDEKNLVDRLKSKDKSALDYLYDHYSGALFGVVSRVIKKEEVAEEVLQDAFLKIWDKIHSYDPEKGRLFTWMLNLTRNLAIDKTRSREISKEGKTSGIDNLVNRIEKREFAEQGIDSIGVKDILNVLPEEQKFVVEHLYFKGYSQSELADEFSIPLGTVKTRLRLAMKQLRSIVKVL
jgi:RNA polymerase sigma factor (sigma-70 family)